MLNSTDWIQYPQITPGLGALGCHSPLVHLLCLHPRHCHGAAGDTWTFHQRFHPCSNTLVLPMSKAMGNDTAVCDKVQYRSPFYHSGYLWEVSKDAFNFPPKFCKTPSETEPSWRTDGTPDLHKCTSGLGIQRDNEEKCFAHASWRHWDYSSGLSPPLM